MLCSFTLHFYITGFRPSSCFHWVRVVRGELGVKRKSDSFSLSPPSALHQDLNFCLHRTKQHMGRVQSTFQAAEHFTSGDVLFFFQIARTSIQSCLEFLSKKKNVLLVTWICLEAVLWSSASLSWPCSSPSRVCSNTHQHEPKWLLTWKSACVYDKCGLY